ncbi:MAG TPA: SPFH domain-containing protein [Ktedonobacterales bacterium]|nr:SPFH domain-containing protein [Ktedonobacterales bacterium]
MPSINAGLTIVVVVALVIVAAIVSVINLYARAYRKVGPNEALIVYGSGGQKVYKGEGVLVLPLVQRAKEFSLELMSFDVAPQQNLYTNQGVAIRVEAVTQLKVRSDHDSILTAAEQFLSKTWEERQGLIRLVMEGHLRGIVGQLTVEQLVKEPEMVSEKMRVISSADLAKMGLEVVSFTIKEVRDENEYITNMGRPEIERIKKEANIAAALAARDTQIQQANASREAAVSKAAADQERVAAEAASQSKQAESQRDLALKRAEYDAEVKKQQVVADKASDVQAQIMQQQIVAETARAQEIEKTAQTKVQEAEAHRREMELDATVIKVADAERQRVQTIAEAERQRISLEAEGRAAALRAQASAEAEATKIRGAADADAARLRGLAEADVIRAKGEAEAEAMRTKANAYRDYNQAAVLDKVVSNLPEIVRAIAEPLAKVDKISIVSTGNGDGGMGASRVTGDVVNMLAQVPAILQAVTGLRMDELMAHIPGLSNVVEGTASANGANGATSDSATPTTNETPPADSQPPEPVAATVPSTPDFSAAPVNGVSPSGATRGPRRQRSR